MSLAEVATICTPDAAVSAISDLNAGSVLHVGVGTGVLGAVLRDRLDLRHGRSTRSEWHCRIDGLTTTAANRGPLIEAVYDRVSKLTPDAPGGHVYDAILVELSALDISDTQVVTVLRTILQHARATVFLVLNSDAHADEYSRWKAVLGLSADDVPATDPDGDPQRGAVSHDCARVDSIWAGEPPARSGTLKVAYVLPGQWLTGGMKMLMEQIRQLRQRGHYVRAVAYDNGSGTVMPPWADVKADEEILLPRGAALHRALRDANVVVLGWFDCIPQAVHSGVPVLYWEQGHEVLFGDLLGGRLQATADSFRVAMTHPVAVAAVSPVVKDILRKQFGREAGLVPNGIDTVKFCPGMRPHRNRVLLVGNPRLKFKGFDTALRVLEKVHHVLGTLEVTWISQAPVQIAGNPFPVNVVVNPPQDRLPELIRCHDVFLSASQYEGFGLPHLEAMASGVPVVSTDNGGIHAFGRPGENCLLADPGDVDSLAWAVVTVLRDESVAEYLSRMGRQTAEAMSWASATDQLEDALYRVATLRELN